MQTYATQQYANETYLGGDVPKRLLGSGSATASGTAVLTYVHVLGAATAPGTAVASATLVSLIPLVAEDLEITFTVVGHLTRPVAFSPPAGLDRKDYSKVNVHMSAPTSYSNGKPQS